MLSHLATAGAISRSCEAVTTWIRRPIARAAASTSLARLSVHDIPGLPSTALTGTETMAAGVVVSTYVPEGPLPSS